MFEYYTIPQFCQPLNQGATTSMPTSETYFPQYQKTSCFLNFQSRFQITKPHQHMPFKLSCRTIKKKNLKKKNSSTWSFVLHVSPQGCRTSSIIKKFQILWWSRKAKPKASLPTVMDILLEYVVEVTLTTTSSLMRLET